MGLFNDEQRNLLIGAGIGLAAAGLLRSSAPAFRSIGRPLAKAAIKSGLNLFDKGREKLAQFGEVFEDLVAEARAELEEEARGRNGGAAPEAAQGEPESIQ
jgi:hypothetical protein